MFLIIILYIFFASSFTFSKAALDYASPVFLVAIRFLIAGALLLIYQYFFDNKEFRCARKDLGLFLQTTIFVCYLAFITDNWALQYVSSANACLVYNLSPFITAILSYILYKTILTQKQITGMIIGFLGYIPLVVGYTQANAGLHTNALPEFILMISVLCGAYGWLIMKRLIVDKQYSVFMVNGLSLFIAGIIAFFHSLVWEGLPVIKFHGTYQSHILYDCIARIMPTSYIDLGMFIFYVFLLIVIAHLVCYNLYAYLLTIYSATFLSFAGFVTPLFAAVLGWFFLDEHLSWNFLVTMIIVSCGIFLFYQDELKQIEKSPFL